MEHVVKFVNARCIFNADEYDHAGDIDDESFGGGQASVSVRDWLRVFKRNEFTLYAVDVGDAKETFRDDPDAEIQLENDDFIVFLNAIASEPKRKYTIGWHGLSYWLCHDIIHAQHDVYGGAVDVNEFAEERTLYEGAIMARQHGTSLAQIVRELARAEPAFLQRFKRPTQALERFLHEVEKDSL